MGIVPAVAHGLFCGRIGRAARFHVEMLGPVAVASGDGVDEAVSFCVGFKEYCRCTVAEKGQGSPVGRVDYRGHLVSAHHDYFLVSARFDILGCRDEGKDKSAAGCENIETEGVLEPAFGSRQVGCRGEEHVRRDRSAYYHVDIERVGVGLFQQVVHRLLGHVRRSEPFSLQDSPGLDADPCHYPFVGGVYHLAELEVVEYIFGKVGSDSCDCSSNFLHQKLRNVSCNLLTSPLLTVFSVWRTMFCMAKADERP